jgi:hypothetical protein
MCVFSNLVRKLLKFYGKIKDKEEKKNGKREKKFGGVKAQPKQLKRPSCVCVCVCVCVNKFYPKSHFCYILVFRS